MALTKELQNELAILRERLKDSDRTIDDMCRVVEILRENRKTSYQPKAGVKARPAKNNSANKTRSKPLSKEQLDLL
jgi:hypothetical protein